MAVSVQAHVLENTEAIRQGFRVALSHAVPTLGATAPNPTVACVLLDSRGTILSLGVHEAAGFPHAEVMALEQARQHGVLDDVSDALVTLEPCAHYGRTPPCSERLRHSPVKTIWIGARDPNPLAAGGGISLQRGPEAKRVVFLDERPEYRDIAEQCQALLRPFASRVVRGRPWVTVKQALDESGRMEPPVGQKTFTSPASLELAHRLRRATDAIVTGIGTVLADEPSFTVRRVTDHRRAKKRLLIVMDRHGRLPREWVQARERDGFIVEACAMVSDMLSVLAKNGVNWVLVEAGPTVLQTLQKEDLWDDWLTIRHDPAQDHDQITWKTRRSADREISPLTFFHPAGGE